MSGRSHAIGIAVVLALPFGLANAAERVVYEPTWESLDRHKTPEWFMNAKLGLFIYSPAPTKEHYQAYHARRGMPGAAHRTFGPQMLQQLLFQDPTRLDVQASIDRLV